MRVCVVGSGGREHALALALSRTAEVVVTPGNPGIPASTPAPPAEIDADLFVIGPEAPLSQGLADDLRSQGKLVFGPGADGARLEGSKAWMKAVAAEAGLPTARHGAFTDEAEAIEFLKGLPGLYVVKTDYLAAGKGVLVTDSLDEAVEDARTKLAHGAIVIEEGMTGPEASVFAVCDGTRAIPLAPAQDFKRVGDGDTGPNTGGMGAYSPYDGVDVDDIIERFVLPTLAVLLDKGVDYRGFLYAGLMLTPEGPKLVEYNVRMGDPEAQVVLPRFDGDLAALLAGAAAGAVAGDEARFVADAAVTVVLASAGYPESPRMGDEIHGVEAAAAHPGVQVFHAGTRLDDQGRLVTAGGRVLAVTALAPTVADARTRAYRAVQEISWAGMHHRTDIAEGAT